MSELTVGGVILARLKALGVDYVFVNSGTDFPPVIEGLAQAIELGLDLPKTILVPHEHAAMGMAHGYYLISGRTQAVMLHTNVGLANATTGAINAACEYVPIIMMSGRTPVTEKTRFGARTVPIGWGQEMFDQAALVREACKWEYELRFPEQSVELVDRAWAIANSTPRGPVYLSLPREVLAESQSIKSLQSKCSLSATRISAGEYEMTQLVGWLTDARNPLIIAQRGINNPESYDKFARIVYDWAIPVCNWWANGLAISTEHPCCIGSDPEPWLTKADLIINLHSLAPWWPDQHHVNPNAKIVNIGPDPIFSRFPIRNFQSNLSIACEVSDFIDQLYSKLQKTRTSNALSQETRLKKIIQSSNKRRDLARKGSMAYSGGVITKDFVSNILGQLIRGHDSVVFSELGANLDIIERRHSNSWFQEPYSGGLGWSFPASIGAKLAKPDMLSIAIMGDGSYIFSNPVACHQVTEALQIGVLIIIVNNTEWGAVRKSVEQMYPDGKARKLNTLPLTSLAPSPDFTSIAKASRAWARRVINPEELSPTLEKGINYVIETEQTALIEIIVDKE